MSAADQLWMLGDVALAMLLGSLIGLEREFARKAAGLRTHMLVAGAAAMLVEGARGLLYQFLSPPASTLVRFDPVPVITAVVTAVGFLGAGTILRQRRPRAYRGPDDGRLDALRGDSGSGDLASRSTCSRPARPSSRS